MKNNNILKALINWSLKEYSDLPWRKQRSLYRTLVSEVMLQQTTVSTVLNHFERFLKVYPDLQTLASATEEEVCIEWKGLGYYRRARNLLKAAKHIQKLYKGKIPADIEQLLEVDGIGPYTANAIRAMGAGKRALAVDANLERVLSRLYAIKTPKGPKLQKDLMAKFEAKEILPGLTDKKARAINEALMDLGRVFCQANKASCDLCMVRKDCQAYQSGNPLQFPIDPKKGQKAESHELSLLRVVVKNKKGILVYKKTSQEWLSGQLELPTFILNSADKSLKQYPQLSKVKQKKVESKKRVTFKQGITKYKITNQVVVLSEKEFSQIVDKSEKYFFRKVHSEKVNFSTATFKALKKIESSN